jgi:hypothetical protein
MKAWSPKVYEAWVGEQEIRPLLESTFPAAINLNQIGTAASEILYALSGRQFTKGGVSTIRPTMIYRDFGYMPWYMASFGGWGTAWSTFPFNPQWPDGLWYDCPSQAELLLPGPVRAITQVKVNGAVLEAGVDYKLFNGRRLVRQASSAAPLTDAAVWPFLQRLDLPDTEQNTWSVTYLWGKPVPSSGYLAAVEMAVQIAKAVANPTDPTIRLPARVTSVASQGVSAVVQDPLNFIERGLTGIPVVDLFLMAFNPYGLRRRSRVVTPDTIALEREAVLEEQVETIERVLPA